MNNLNLENLKAGDEIVAIFVNPSHTREGKKYGKVCTILGKDPIREEWLTHGLAKISLDGKGFFAMSRRIKPDFYWSANPVHIKAAKKQEEKASKIREKKEKLLAEKRELLSPLLESYRDNEECFSFEYLSTESLEKLSISQIKTLKKWLTV